jgi:hypothetical protein
MNVRRARLLCVVLALGLRAAALHAQAGCANQSVAGCTPQLVAAVMRLSGVLDSLGHLPTPRDAPAADRTVAVKFSTWLREASVRMGALGARARKPTPAPRPGSGKSPMEFGKALLTLQQRLLREGASFTLKSRTLRARHDLAIRAIGDLK